ncbi:MAG: TrmH family RNA methyltransferase, partial [Planctomycetota bacterium]
VDGVVGIAKRPETSLKYWVPRKFGFVVVMEAIEKPGNVGAVFRSCVAAGADAFIAADPITDVFHPNAIRSSLGAVFSVPVFCGNSKDIVETLGAEEFQIAAAVVNAKSDFREITFSKRSAIVLGNESAGLSAIWNSPPSIPVKIPMSESIDSLNIAMSATILAYEVQRQRLHNSDCE